MATERTPGTDLETPYEVLVRRAMEQVKSGKLTIAEVVAQLAGDRLPEAPSPAAPARVPELSPEVLKALRSLPALWEAVVVPSAPRKMTGPESTAMARLRLAIDVISGPLAKAKSEIIRDSVANHLDAVAEQQGMAQPEESAGGLTPEATPRDASGHYLLKQYDPVEGTGHRWERRVSKGGVSVSSVKIKEAHDDGHLTREQYLALTSVPEVPRVFDPEKARKAIVKDPALLALLAAHGASVSQASTSIYLTPDK